MAVLVALRAALTHMGFTPAVTTFIKDTQGMNDLEEFLLMDDEGVRTLCKAIRHPGGQVPNPAFAAAGTAAAAAATGIPVNISNPGYVVSTRAETNLKLMCYFLCYCRSTSRDTEAAIITLAAVRSMKTHKDWESNHVDIKAPELNDKDWARTFEAIDEWLCGCLGEFTSYFPSRKPTKEEFENTPEDLRVKLTAEALDWDPALKTFQQQEEAMLQADGQLKDPIESWSLRCTISVLNSIPQSETLDFHLGDAMHSHKLVDTDTHGPQTIASIIGGVRKPCIQATQLAKNWGIGLETATCTVEATTQRGLRTVLHNTVS